MQFSNTNLQLKIFICEHLVYVINQTIFFTYEWFGLRLHNPMR